MGIDPIQPFCPANLAAAEHFKPSILQNVLAGFAVDGLGKSLVTGAQTGAELGLQRANQGGDPCPGKEGVAPCTVEFAPRTEGVAPCAVGVAPCAVGVAPCTVGVGYRLPGVARGKAGLEPDRFMGLSWVARRAPGEIPRALWRIGGRSLRRMHAGADARVQVQRPGPEDLPGRRGGLPSLPGNPAVQRKDFNGKSLPVQHNGTEMHLSLKNMKVPGLRFLGVVAMKECVAACGLIRPCDLREVQLVVVETAILRRIERTEQTEYPAAGVLLT